MKANNEIHDNRGNAVQAGHIGSVHITSPAPPTALNGLRDASESFTGRAAELAELSGAAGLTVVSGLAGVGKTELVLRHACSGEFPGGKLFVDLQDYDDERRVTPAQALEEFLSALGVREIPATEAARTALFRTLTAAREPMLVVIDNAQSAEHVLPLVPNRHRAIVTSRHKLVGLDDAHHLELGVLPREEAIELVGNTELAEMCGRLPLALRIMVALRRTDPDHDWVTELRNVQLDLLDDGDQRSVRAAFDLSYQVLTEEQRQLFRLAALHPSHEVTIEGAAQLAGCSETVARKLMRDLRTAHLIEPGDRYHDLVRQFAVDCVRKEEDTESRVEATTRLMSHFVERAEQMNDKLRTSNQAKAWRWFDRHRPTLVALVLPMMLVGHFHEAGRLARALDTYLNARGHHDDRDMVAQLAMDAARNLLGPWLELGDRVDLRYASVWVPKDKGALSRLYAAWGLLRRAHDLAL